MAKLRSWKRIAVGTALALVVTAFVAACLTARSEAHNLLTNPIETRKLPSRRPIDYGAVSDEVTVITKDGLHLAGWYIPSTNGAVVLAQHGYKANRGEMLEEAGMLARHGYGVLITSMRAHDLSDGTLITFGKFEIDDLQSWFDFAARQADVDPARIGILGNSLGGTLAIGLAARNQAVKAVAANSPFSSLTDTIETSVRFFTGLPPFPFAPLITFFAEREAHFRAADIDAKAWIRQVSPRPVLLMQGGADVVISRESGRLLFENAGEPKELWAEPRVGHSGFDTAQPEEYERRVVRFFDRYLLDR